MEKTTAIGYARRSTDMQERSIPDQQAYVEQWAAEHGYVIKRWYVDDAISGTSTKGRDAFERLIRDAESAKDFDVILCYDISRFSRGGTNETGYYLHRLHVAGVEAIFCADGIPAGDEGELLQGVKSWQARQYSVKLSKDSIRGQISNIMVRHCAPGGAPPFGYDKQHVAADGRVLRTFRYLSDGRKEEYDSTGRLVRVLPRGETVKKAKSDVVRYVPSTPDRVAIIKRMFETVADGYGSRHIAATLNREGVPSPDGTTWSSPQIRKYIANPVYKGSVVWNKKTKAKLHGVGRDGKLRPRRGTYVTRLNAPSDWYVVDNVHEPLVSRELFDAVQRIQDSRRHLGGRAKTGNRSLLSGLMICTRCHWHFGQAHEHRIVQGQRIKRRYYIDKGYHNGGTAVCKCTRLPADALDAWVTDKVRSALLGEHETAEAAIEAFVQQALTMRDEPTNTAAAEKELESINRRIKAMMAMLADPSFEGLEELKTTLADLAAKRDALSAKLEETKSAATPVNEADVRAWAAERFEQMANVMAKTTSIVEARTLIHSVVDRIEIDSKANTGVLYLPQDVFSSFVRGRSTMGGPQNWELGTKELRN